MAIDDLWEPRSSGLEPYMTRAAAAAEEDSQSALPVTDAAPDLEGVFHPHFVEGQGSYPIEILSEWLGQSYLTRLGGFRAWASLPRRGDDGDGLKPPKFTADPGNWDEWTFPREPERRKWGDADTGASSVVRVRDFRIGVWIGSGVDRADAAERARSDIPRWWRLARSWIELLTEQDLQGADQFSFSAGTLSLWDTSDGRQYPADSMVSHTLTPTLGFGGDDYLAIAFQAAGLDHAPPIEWQTLRESVAAHRRGHYRRAVLEAGIASEMALVRYLFRKRAVSATERTPPLGVLVKEERKWATSNGVHSIVPGQFSDVVHERRNAVAHRGAQPGESDALESIDCSLQLVATVLPREVLTEPCGLITPYE